MFGRDKTPSTPPPADVTPKPTGKGHATPTRKQAESANKRPLVPQDRKAAGKTSKEEARRQRDLEYRAMTSGDEEHMPAQHRGPVRRFLRDSVDSRRTLAEFVLPIALVLLIVAMLASGWLASSVANGSLIATGGMLLPYGYIAIAAIETFVRWRGVKAELIRRFGAAAVVRGTAGYYVTRVFQVRRLRMPKPQIKVGEPPR